MGDILIYGVARLGCSFVKEDLKMGIEATFKKVHYLKTYDDFFNCLFSEIS